MSQNANGMVPKIMLPLPEYRAFRTLAYSLYPGCVPKPVVPAPSYEERALVVPSEAVSETPETDQLVGWPRLAIAGLAWSIRNLEHEIALHAFARLWNAELDVDRRRHYETLLSLARAAAARLLDALNKIEAIQGIQNGPLAALRSPLDGKFDA